jgi:hypothetical protein
LTAFPCLFIDGDLAFYGGIPSVEAIEEYLRAHLDSLTAKSSAASTDQPAQRA